MDVLDTKTIKYKAGYEYQLYEDARYMSNIKGYLVALPFINIYPSGEIVAHKGYAWDGASGAVDTKTIMRGSLFHDVLYQAMRHGKIDRNERCKADDLLIDICDEDGMLEVRQWWVEEGVELFGKKFVQEDAIKPILCAP